MHPALRQFILLILCAVAGILIHASAQSVSTASRRITPSVFAGVTGVSTGLDSGKNLSMTAGVDLAFLPGSKVHPALEYRGMYAFEKGGVDSLKSNLGGLKLFKSYGRFYPYVDLLAGRGETTYANGGFQVPNKPIFYTKSSSNVFAVGGGADVLVTQHFSLKVDLQIHRYSSPVTASGHLYSETGTVGLVYLFNTGRAVR